MSAQAEAEKANQDTATASAEQAKAQPQPQTQQAKPTTEEKQTNCLGCGKPLKKLKRYYRNGKFYCNKKCWRKTITSKEKETEAGK